MPAFYGIRLRFVEHTGTGVKTQISENRLCRGQRGVEGQDGTSPKAPDQR